MDTNRQSTIHTPRLSSEKKLSRKYFAFFRGNELNEKCKNDAKFHKNNFEKKNPRKPYVLLMQQITAQKKRVEFSALRAQP